MFKTAYNVSSCSVHLLTCTPHNKHERATKTHGYRCTTFHRVWRSGGSDEMPKKHPRAAENVLTFYILVVSCIIIAFCFPWHSIWFVINPWNVSLVCIRNQTWSLLCACWWIATKWWIADTMMVEASDISFKVGLGVWRCFHWHIDIIQNGCQDFSARSELTHPPRTKWPPFRRRYFLMGFHEWKVFTFLI